MGTAQAMVTAAVVIAAAIAIVRFELLCVRDLADAPEAELRYLTRAGWLTAIVFAIPMGGVAYLCIGRTR